MAEVSCPTVYTAESSSISFARSVRYGFGCLDTALRFRAVRLGWLRSSLFPADAGGSAPAVPGG